MAGHLFFLSLRFEEGPATLPGAVVSKAISPTGPLGFSGEHGVPVASVRARFVYDIRGVLISGGSARRVKTTVCQYAKRRTDKL
jgi:hypothetical protein